MDKKVQTYIPALRYHWLTSLYDPLLQIAMHDTTFKRRLIRQAYVKSNQRILDLGCGTATLSLLLKEMYPNSEVIGLDADANVLAIARAKITRQDEDIELVQALSFDTPFTDTIFDHVFSSLFFHHLTQENKLRTLHEMFRVLVPGGTLHIADWGKAQDWLMRLAFIPVQMLDSFETTNDNVKGRLPEICRSAGFQNVQQKSCSRTLFGTLSFYQATKQEA